jgi:RNA polymerase sigma factor (sigma-70 family)
VSALDDDALRALIRTDPDAGWRAFIDQYTPLIVGLIRKAGLTDRDETMEVYVLICERLSERRYERLRGQDATRGSIGGWLAVIARHAAVDWIRSRKGRRRVFQSVRTLDAFDQRVFELYYWDDRTPAEIAGLLRRDLPDVLEALDRIQSALSARHRAELMSMALRSKAPVGLDETDAAETIADPRANPEAAAQFESCLRQLSKEDAAIVRLKYVEGLTDAEIERATGLSVTAARTTSILTRLRTLLGGKP